jgi:hypothetical protein
MATGPVREDVAGLIARRQYAKAIDILRAQLKTSGADPRLLMQLADALEMAAKPREAVVVLMQLADEYAREGFAAKAISVLKRIQKIEPYRRDIEGRLAELIETKQRQATVSMPSAQPGGFEIGMEEIGFEPPPDGPVAVPVREPPRDGGPELGMEIGFAPPSRGPIALPVREPEAPPARPPAPPPPVSLDLGLPEAPDALRFDSAPLDLGFGDVPAPTPSAPPAPSPSAPRTRPSAPPPLPAMPSPVEDRDLFTEADLEPIATEAPADLDLPTLEAEPLVEAEPVSESPDGAFADELMSIFDEIFPGAEAAPSAAPAAASSGTQIVVSPLFADFAVDEMVAVIQGLRLLTFDRGKVILREGDRGDSLYMLTSGSVRAFVKKDGRQAPLADIDEGAFFGEMSILTGKPRTATIVALDRCELLELDRTTLNEITKAHPHVWDVLKEFAARRVGKRT